MVKSPGSAPWYDATPGLRRAISEFGLLSGSAAALAAANPVLAEGQESVETDTGVRKLGDGSTAYSDLTPLPGGGSGGLPIADAAGVTTGTADNPITGSGTYNWVQFPADTPAIAWGIEGDEFPRVVFGADPNDFCLVAIGDGTFDPVNSSATMYLGTVDGHPAMGISKLAVGVVRLVSGGTSGYDLAFDESTGVIVTDASDGHTYRLGTDNGAVTATQVT